MPERKKRYLKERSSCLYKAVAYHFWALAGLVFFACLALFFAYLAIHLKFYVFLSFQLVWILLVYFGYTLVESIAYYYEKNLIRKFGKNINGQVISKYKEENDLYTDDIPGRRRKYDREIFYFIEYQYSYEGEDYQNAFVTENHHLYDKLEAGDAVPVRILKIKPSASDIRLRKLKKDLAVT